MSSDNSMSLEITVKLTDAPDDVITEAFARAKALMLLVDGLTPGATKHVKVTTDPEVAAAAAKPKQRKAKAVKATLAPALEALEELLQEQNEDDPEIAAKVEEAEADSENAWTEDTLRDLCAQVLSVHGNKVITDTLKAFNVKKLSQLDPDVYGQFADTLREAVA